jgi:hypothetical protein
MALQFMSITDDEKQAIVADAIVGRERELWSYQLNIDNYVAMLAALPQGDWPAALAQFKQLRPEAVAEAVPMENAQAVHDLLYRDKIAYLLGTEKIEQGKSIRVLDALLTQLPAGQAQALVTAAKARLAAAG